MIRKIASISASTALGQIAQVVAFLVLARMLAPENFGLYGAFMAVLALTTAVGAFRYELAFGLVEGTDRLLSVLLVVFAAVLVLGVVAGVGAGIFVFLGGAELVEFSYASGPFSLALLVAIGTITLILGEAITYLSLRLERHVSVAVYSLLRPSLVGVCQFGFVMLFPSRSAEALVFGAVTGQALALVSYYSVIQATIGLSSSGHLREVLLDTTKRFAYLTRSQAPQQLMSRVGLNALPIVLPGSFGAAVGGWYVAANRVLCTPSQVFGKVLRGVYFAEAADRVRRGRSLKDLHFLTSMSLASFALLYFVPVALYSEEIIRVVFGSQWIGAAPMMSILAIFWWSAIVNIPSSALIAPLKLDAWYVRYESSLLAVRLAVVLIGIVLSDYFVLVGLFAVSGFLFNLYLVVKVRREILLRGVDEN